MRCSGGRGPGSSAGVAVVFGDGNLGNAVKGALVCRGFAWFLLPSAGW